VLIGTIIWIICVEVIIHKYDVMLLDSINKMSRDYHFIFLSFLITCCLYLIYRLFFPEKIQEFNESFIWITFITTMSISCQNLLGDDIDTFHYLYFSLTVLYLIYVCRLIHPKEEKLVALKIIIVILVLLKIFWPGLTYLWPYGTDYPDDFDWTGWPYIKF
jgi:hypothetical protein